MKPQLPRADSSVTRRSWLKVAAGLGATTLLPRQVAAQPVNRAESAAGSIVVSDSAAIAQTTHGKVRGFTHREMFVFRGIPYGAPTSGAGRFMPPAKPAAWSGVRSALAYGQARRLGSIRAKTHGISPYGIMSRDRSPTSIGTAGAMSGDFTRTTSRRPDWAELWRRLKNENSPASRRKQSRQPKVTNKRRRPR
jgi:hypothetical protein